MSKDEIKYVGTCECGRGIERGDDVVERNGVVYHDGCEPPAEPETIVESEPVVEPIEEVVSAQPREGGKKVKKEDLMEQLLGLVSVLTAEVAALKARPVSLVATAAAKAKSKAEKGAPRPDVYYVVKGYASEKRPPQFLKVSRALAQAAPEGGRMTEMDVWNALMEGPHPSEKASKNVGSWNYRQTPFYIFKYYRKDMINAEYILGPFDVV